MTIIPDTTSHHWRNVLIYVVTGILIGVLLATAFTCEDDDDTGDVEYVAGGTVTFYDTDTVETTRVVYRDRWHAVNVPARVVYDTMAIDGEPVTVTTPPYIARLDTVTATADTIGITFRHPAQTFDVAFRPRPDSIRTVTIEALQVVAVPDKDRIGFGVAAGMGAVIGFDGVARPGGYVGVGINFNIWEP